MDDLRAPACCRVMPIAAPMNAPAFVQALKGADVLISTADSDAARLGAALLAALFHKVLLDIGTGVLASPEPPPTGVDADSSESGGRPAPVVLMGTDIRLVLPGDGCLLCRGGLTNYVQAVSDLVRRRSARATVRLDAARRMGLLRSLNHLAVTTGLRMLEELVAMRLHASTWARLEYGETGHLDVRYLEPPVDRACTMCANAGLGDEGL